MEAKTPRDRLQWLIDAIERRKPTTDAQAWQYLRELQSFAGPRVPRGVAKFTNVKNYVVDALENCRDMVDQAAARQDISKLPRPQSQALRWDAVARRYRREIKPESPIFENYLIGAVGDLLEAVGHWLKYCEASAKRSAGRKSAIQHEEIEGKCDKLFVAFKETQRFCSPQCLHRTLTRKRRNKNKAKVKAK